MILKTAFGSFGKGLDGSIAFNFGQSGGVYCDISCVAHPDHIGPNKLQGKLACYAARLELQRKSMRVNLDRKQNTSPAVLCGMALLELQYMAAQGVVVPWFRFSVSGSVPKPSQVRFDQLFRAQFRALVQWLVNYGVDVHLPLESYGKARFYRSLVGDLITVRESAQTERRFLTAKGAVSVVAGSGLPRAERTAAAAKLAKQRTAASGRKCIVCPAITHGWAHRYDGMRKNNRAKCGACVACADSLVDIVYPMH
jgi:hypothetical protein